MNNKKKTVAFPLKKKMKKPKYQLEMFKRGIFIKNLMAVVVRIWGQSIWECGHQLSGTCCMDL